MNIRKYNEWHDSEGIMKTMPMWITKQWRRITGYKTRGYKNRVSLVGWSRTYIAEPELTKHIKRNRVHRLCLLNNTISK